MTFAVTATIFTSAFGRCSFFTLFIGFISRGLFLPLRRRRSRSMDTKTCWNGGLKRQFQSSLRRRSGRALTPLFQARLRRDIEHSASRHSPTRCAEVCAVSAETSGCSVLGTHLITHFASIPNSCV